LNRPATSAMARESSVRGRQGRPGRGAQPSVRGARRGHGAEPDVEMGAMDRAHQALPRPRSARFGAVDESRGFDHWFSFLAPSRLACGPGPSGSAGPSLRCQDCSRLSPHLRGSAVLSFIRPLRRPVVGSHTPPGNSEVDPGRPVGVATGGSPQAASRTRRAPQSAPGSPQAAEVRDWPHAVLGHGVGMRVPR
jgi:hypothetical protein